VLNTKGLSLANSPPIVLPLHFFLSAPWFAIVAGLMIVFEGESLILSRWMPGTLALVHLLVLGFISMIMMGALLQILPVLLGATGSASTRQGTLMVVGLTLGTMLLASGFHFTEHSILFMGALLAAITLMLFMVLAGRALLSAGGPGRARVTVGMSILALTVAVVLGLVLGGSRAGWLTLPAHQTWVDIHLSWGLIGWMGLLLIGIASELMPMFYLSPAYPGWLKQHLPAILLFLLALLFWPLWQHEQPAVLRTVQTGLLIAFSSFAIASFVLQYRRRRPRWDATLGFWWLGQTGIVLTVIAWLTDMPASLLGILAIGSGMAFTNGTLYKIVPFLSWYHLQSRKVMLRRTDVKLPTMQQFIGETAARWQLATLVAALILLALTAWPGISTARAGGVMLVVSALLLLLNLLKAYRLFRAINSKM
jgi:hypothetical protein